MLEVKNVKIVDAESCAKDIGNIVDNKWINLQELYEKEYPEER